MTGSCAISTETSLLKIDLDPGRDLGYFFHVLEAVRSALVERALSGTSGSGADDKSVSALALCMKLKSRRLLMSIDDCAERRIYAKAQNIVEKIEASALEFAELTLMEIYLCRRVFINGDKYKTHLYNHDPKPELLILSQHSGHGSKEGCSVKPLDVVRQIHGANCAYRLNSLFAEAGL